MDREAAIQWRAAFGLPTDDATMTAVASEGVAVAEDVPMTEAEERQLNIDGRMAFQIDVDEDIAPYVTSLSTYAGMYFDSANGGGLVVMLTKDSPEIRSEIKRRLPASNLGLEIVQADHLYRDLRPAAKAALALWMGTPGLPAPLSAGVDTRGNQIRLQVLEADLDRAVGMRAELEAQLDVPVLIESGRPASDTACSDRDHCDGTLHPGIRIAKGDTTSDDCTMAFHVYEAYTSNLSWINAGHCGYTGTDAWYHEGYNGPNGRRIGLETGSLLTQGFDIMRVGMYDSVASRLIYGSGRQVNGWKDDDYNFQGSTLKASRGKSQDIVPGTVESDWTSWVSDKGGYVTVWGLNTTLPSVPGDSGSPVYQEVGNYAIAVGVLNNQNGNVSLIDSCYEAWGDNGCRPY